MYFATFCHFLSVLTTRLRPTSSSWGRARSGVSVVAIHFGYASRCSANLGQSRQQDLRTPLPAGIASAPQSLSTNNTSRWVTSPKRIPCVSPLSRRAVHGFSLPARPREHVDPVTAFRTRRSGTDDLSPSAPLSVWFGYGVRDAVFGCGTPDFSVVRQSVAFAACSMTSVTSAGLAIIDRCGASI
jgi:hypothetical protein